MSEQFDYDGSYDPPAPLVPFRVADPGGEVGVLLPGLLDSGADCTLIPLDIADRLRLPLVGRVEIAGVGGGGGTAPIYAARVEIAGTHVLARLVAYENDVIVGRDVMNRIVALLDGPQLRVQLFSRRRGEH